MNEQTTDAATLQLSEEPINTASLNLILKKRGLSAKDVPELPEGRNPMASRQTKRDIAQRLGINPGILNMEVTLWELSDLGLLQTLADRMTYLADKAGLTADEIAKQTGLTAEQIKSKMDGSEKKMSMAYLISLSEFFNVTPGFIRYGNTSERTDVFWYKLGKLMADNKLSDNEAAEAVDIPVNRLKGMLKGTSFPTEEEISRIADYFHEDPSKFSKVQLKPDGTFSDEKRKSRKKGQAAKHPQTWKNSGSLLSKIIQDMGMTEKAFAGQCGVPAMAVSCYANGKKYTADDADYKRRIAYYLDMDIDEIFPEDEKSDDVQTDDMRKPYPDMPEQKDDAASAGDGNGSMKAPIQMSLPLEEEGKNPVAELLRGCPDKATSSQVTTMIWDRSPEDWDVILRYINDVKRFSEDLGGKNRDVLGLLLGMDMQEMDLLEENIQLMKKAKCRP